MNITTLTRENYEADDIIASLADQGAAQGFEVLIVSGDRDTFQLIQEEVTILYPVKGVMNLARMNDAAVVEKYGIHAKQYPDLAALVGETSDNLPGIPGVGPKTAAKWLQQYGDLASILKAAEEISGKVGESLREHRELVVRNRKLNHLVRDLDIGMPFESFAMKPVEEDNLRATFAKLHFRSLLERVFKGLGVIRSDKANVEAITLVSQAETTGAAQTQLELPNATELSEKALEKLFSSKTVVAVFPVFDEGDLIGVGLATDKERLYLDYKSNKKELGKFFESDVTKNIFDSKRIQRWLLNQKIHLESVIDDPMLMAYVENPLRRNFGAEELISEFLGLSISSTQEIGEDGLDLSAIAWYLNPLCKKINETLVQSKQDFIYKSVELPSARALAKMEQVGVSINTADLTKLIKQLDKEISQLASECYKIIAKEINLASPKQLQTVLFDDLGMQGTSKVKTGFSTNAEALTTLFEQTGHPFLEKLLQHREVTKIRQIVETISKTVESDGRIHTTYVQTGTSTGRLSSENPNLQNIPVRTERGRLIRDAFVVGDDFETLLTADYSQIEMRILAHLSQDSGLIEAFKSGEDLHKFVGARIYGVQPDEVTSAMRSKVKAMSYGLVYGLSEYGLAKQLRISNADAKQLMADYFARFGGVRNYLAKVVDDAKLNGFTTTIYGRRRPFDDLNSKIFTIRENARRAALNAPIQGTAADIMKLAMIKVDHLLVEAKMKSRILLQVHDELVIEVAKGELEKVKSLAIKGMTEAAKLDVPLEVSIGVGKSWDEAAH